MLRKSPGEEQLGCLFALLGGIVGFVLGNISLDRLEARMLAEDPPSAPCGLGVIPVLFGAIPLGGIAGWIVGVILYRLFRPSRPG